VLTRTSCLAVSSVCLLGGCVSAPTPPLFFGDIATFGIDIGAGPGSEGVDFNLGFKQKSLAIVPVSAVNSGNADEIVAWNQENGGNRRDALSVFGQFKSQAGTSADDGTAKTARSITLGRFFATGLAATNLAEGYKTGWQDSPNQPEGAALMRSPASAPSSQPARKEPRSDSNGQTKISSLAAEPLQAGAPSKTEAYAPPLIFGQSQTWGIGVATAIADQGIHFTMGYAGRDIAFVPVMASGSSGLTRLGGRDQVGADGNLTQHPEESREADAFSVFGQFEGNTETTSVRFGLNTFFTTGIAARSLTDGYKAAIARELRAQRQLLMNPGGAPQTSPQAQ
jgi:hypothetical protein